jgi:methionyl aminopeptidase
MISIKNEEALARMAMAGDLLAGVFEKLPSMCCEGCSTAELDSFIEQELSNNGLLSMMKGYMGYGHVSCISLNDEVVHGVPCEKKKLNTGDLVKIDVCAAYRGYCADMARPYFVGFVAEDNPRRVFVEFAQRALDEGIREARVGNRLTDISAAIQREVERGGYGVVRDFAGHGIGRRMHEDPEILNYGKSGRGPLLEAGMVFALEPMLTMGGYAVYVSDDNWTVKTIDGSLAMHVEDTVAVTKEGPKILTRKSTCGTSMVSGDRL